MQARPRRLMDIHFKICRSAMECPMCKHIVGTNGTGSHGSGCTYTRSLRGIPQAGYSSHLMPQQTVTGGITPQQLLNLSGPSSAMSTNPLSTSNSGSVPYSRLPRPGSASIQVCIHCQQRFTGSPNDHLEYCTKVLKCSYCFTIMNSDRELRYHVAQQCTVARDTASHGIPPSQLSRLPAYFYSGHETQCLICQAPILLHQSVKQLQCFHVFHAGCIDTVLMKKAVCPVDKSPVTIPT